jgi:ABC-type Fe3+ transport system permease subunit
MGDDVHRCWLLLLGVALGATTSLQGQGLRVDPVSAAARAVLRPADVPTSPFLRPPGASRIADDTVGRKHRSRLGTAGLGFLAGAATGMVVAYLVDRTKDTGDGRLENYIAIPLALGTVTFMTVFVAMGD